ncbi:MAG: alpha/beta hydrolase [Thermomicrobiales bacterium]|nr:alpha/beta hydrolase [Thermomicrobiales bacterium]
MQTTTQSLSFSWRDLSLVGTLHLPEGDEPHPAIVMLQGSGESDRDSYGYFPPIRDALLRRGIAVYSFDKPGIGESNGDWRGYALYDRADQGMAAIEAVRGADGIDSQCVGVWGHSQGGWIVQILAADHPELPFAVASAGPGIDVTAQDLYGCEQLLRKAGLSDDEIQRSLAEFEAVHHAAMRGDDFTTVQQMLQGAKDELWYQYLPIEDAEFWQMMVAFTQEAYDPPATLARIQGPFLAVFGSLDPLLPARESARICSEALDAAGNANGTVALFSGANHRLLIEETGEFAGGYLDLLGAWVARFAGVADS